MMVLMMTMAATVTTTQLQQRIDQAEPGATVRLEPKTYVGAIVIRRSIHIVGVPGETVLDAAKEGTAIRVDDGEVTLEGLTVVNGRGRYGGALAIDNEARVRLLDCVLSGNRAKHRGGGAYVERGVLRAERTTFAGNRAEQGGGVFAGGDAKVTIAMSFAHDNRADEGGFVAAADFARVVLRGVQVAKNAEPQVHAIEGGMTKPSIELVTVQ
ncbi:MAG: hypothetical protein RMA76_02185 [Deltaproteobacteria bacterium]